MSLRSALAILLLLSACSKDYPLDIPDWVEDRIRKCRRPFADCGDLSVKEFQGLGQRWFYFREGDGTDELFAEDGSAVCGGTDIFVDESQCAAVVLDSLHQVRTIWVER